ncbi:MAG TPA: hypothetical protein VEI51_02840 [Methanomicrobiales archaeon]|nr:hypothetical protein [Methanomicrobiales archaeon]
MKGEIPKILISALCAALLILAGCTAPAPTTGAAPTPAVTAGQAPVANPDIGSILSELQAVNTGVSQIAQNTQPQPKGILAGNVVLFDDAGNAANAIQSGSAVAAVPLGTCDIAIYSTAIMRATVEEMNSYVTSESSKYSRNRQACVDTFFCRKSVSTDNGYAFLFFTFTASSSSAPLNRVTLSYRCLQV